MLARADTDPFEVFHAAMTSMVELDIIELDVKLDSAAFAPPGARTDELDVLATADTEPLVVFHTVETSIVELDVVELEVALASVAFASPRASTDALDVFGAAFHTDE